VYLMRSERTRLASIRDRVFFRACGIRHLTGFYAIPRALLYRRTRDGYAASVPHESERLVARVAEDRCVESSVYGFPLLPIVGDDRWECVRHLKSIRRFPQRPMVAVCPGCKRNANRWPQESFVELTRLLAKTGQFEIVLIGGPAESGAGLAIGRAVDGVIDCCGRLGIRDSAAILSLCSLAVGLNTGTTHLAAALGIPCVAVYAAQDSPGQWDPLGTSHRLLRRRIQCEGCRAERCPRPDHPCMSGITPTEVFDAVMEVAASTRPGRREPGGSVLTPGLALPGV
jgi:ADP-heptose:LPS heptosyltransferase